MADADQLLSRFIDEWNAGHQPSVENFLSQLPETDRDEFAEQISTFLTFASTPRFDDRTLDELTQTPAVKAAVQAFEAEEGAWPMLLPRMRAQAGLSLRELAARVLTAAGLGERGVAKAEQRLVAMERGEIDATGVSSRIIDVLGRVLEVNPRILAQLGTPAAAPAGGALYRRQDDEGHLAAGLDLVADALSMPAPEGEWDEVDELFFGRG